MFDFFEGLIENLGIKLVSDFTDKLIDFIKNVKESKETDNSSGDRAQIGSSGYGAQIGSSGYRAQIGSSGDGAQIGSSGNETQIGSSGDRAQIGSSGDGAQIGSSGDRAQIGSSGDRAQIDISGDNTVGFACGWRSIIKARKGTWISLCEWKRNEQGVWIPILALSAQIGNKEYKDFKGRILKETEYYCLHNQKFYPVDISDGLKVIKISEKKRENTTIIKGSTFDNEAVYLVKEGELKAHGNTLKQAMEDLTFKKLKDVEVSEIVKEIKETEKVTRLQYRAITGACQFGTEQFCKEHSIENLKEIKIEELRKILTLDNYGAKRFWNLIDGE